MTPPETATNSTRDLRKNHKSPRTRRADKRSVIRRQVPCQCNSCITTEPAAADDGAKTRLFRPTTSRMLHH